MTDQSASGVSKSGPYLSFRRHGEVAVVTVSAAIEDLPPNLVETAAQVVLSPLKESPPSNVIVDLAEVLLVGEDGPVAGLGLQDADLRLAIDHGLKRDGMPVGRDAGAHGGGGSRPSAPNSFGGVLACPSRPSMGSSSTTR